MMDFNAAWFRYVPTAGHIVQVFFHDGQTLFVVEWSGVIFPGAYIDLHSARLAGNWPTHCRDAKRSN